MKTRFLVIALPIASFIVSALVVGIQVKRTFVAEGDRARLRASVEKLRAQMEPTDALDEVLQVPAVAASESEQAAFLDELRSAAATAGIQLVKWNFVVKRGAKKGDGVTLEGSTPIECTLDVAGTYPSLRAFLYDLSKAERFYAIGNVSWKRDRDRYPNTTLSFTLTRFVNETAATTVATTRSGDTPGVTG
ncbi:MAG: hypothetical protein AMXMBFR81_23170 [Chthonomonas sp.]